MRVMLDIHSGGSPSSSIINDSVDLGRFVS